MMNDDEQRALNAFLDTQIDLFVRTNRLMPPLEFNQALFAAGLAYAQKWRSMESAPKDGTRILGFARKYYAAVCWDESGDGSFQWEDYDCNRWEPTHWMPLPLPPTEVK